MVVFPMPASPSMTSAHASTDMRSRNCTAAANSPSRPTIVPARPIVLATPPPRWTHRSYDARCV